MRVKTIFRDMYWAFRRDIKVWRVVIPTVIITGIALGAGLRSCFNNNAGNAPRVIETSPVEVRNEPTAPSQSASFIIE